VIATGAAANAATINSPLAELDAAIKKNEYAKAAAPGVNDDSGDGYSVGTRWVDTTNDRAYICMDASAGAAIWHELQRKANLAATTGPTLNDDTGDGYDVSSLWLDTTNDKSYICVDATVGAAKWFRIDIGNRDILLGPGDFYIVAGTPAQGVIGIQPTWRLDSTATETIGAAKYYPGPTGGSAVKVLVLWCMESATVNQVYFTVSVASISNGADGNVAGTSHSGALTVSGTAKYVKQTQWTCSESYLSGDLIQVSISRIGGHGDDDATGDCHILAAVLRFE